MYSMLHMNDEKVKKKELQVEQGQLLVALGLFISSNWNKDVEIFTLQSSDDSLYEEYPLEFVVHPPK